MAKLTSEREIALPVLRRRPDGLTSTSAVSVSHEAPAEPGSPELDNAQRILAEQAAKRDALFEQSFENEKNKG